MSRTYKRFKGKLAKQMLAEQEFERGEEDNHKVASKLELPYVGKKIDNTTFSTLTNVQGSFAGFVRLTPKKNAVQILTNLEG